MIAAVEVKVSFTHFNKFLLSYSTFVCVLLELEPYKYAGYPMLIKTITLETGDEQLFSKNSPLLPAAAELAFHTVNYSALNAEELRMALRQSSHRNGEREYCLPSEYFMC